MRHQTSDLRAVSVDLHEALAIIAAGWNAPHEITDRALQMRSHAQAGNVQRAEEYAVEIEALQRAHDERHGTPPAQMPDWAVDAWKIGHVAWANVLMHGWLCKRDFWVADGATVEKALGWLHHRHQGKSFTAADVMVRPLPLGRVA